MSSRPSSLSIVEYFAEHTGYKCGYCKKEDTNFSHGMWGHTLTTQDYQVNIITSAASIIIVCVSLSIGLDRSRLAKIWAVLLQAYNGQDLLPSLHYPV